VNLVDTRGSLGSTRQPSGTSRGHNNANGGVAATLVSDRKGILLIIQAYGRATSAAKLGSNATRSPYAYRGREPQFGLPDAIA
jgi:hypothetical protein